MAIKRSTSHRLLNLDWEPLHITISVKAGTVLSPFTLDKVMKQWLQDRQKQPFCRNDCKTNFWRIDIRPSGEIADVLIEWVCDECLPQLIGFIAKEIPTLEVAEVGWRDSVKGMETTLPSIKIESRNVILENNHQEIVGPFRISLQPITVGEYRHFCEQSNYITTGEARGHFDTYRDNGLLSAIDPQEQDRFAASFLSHADAEIYCKIKGFRLPTDAELLAAITIDDKIHDFNEHERSLLLHSGKVLRTPGFTLTSTSEGELIVVRRGPWVAKHSGWNHKTPAYRQLVSKASCVGQFYICW